MFPQLKGVDIEFAWGGHIDLTINRTPDVGGERNRYWLQGYSGHGVLPTLAAARAVSDAILGDADELALYQGLSNGSFPGGKYLAAPLEAIGKAWYRLRDSLDELSGIPVMDKQEEIAALAILIHDLRKHKKWTLKELADKIGRSVGFLSQVERGLSRPTVADLTAISETFGVPTTYFYSLPKPKELPWVTRPDERRTLYYANGITDILVSPQIRASFSMLESHLEAGASSGDRHLTDSSEQGGYVLEGELTLWLGDDEDPVTLQGRRQLSVRQSHPLPLRQPHRAADPRALGLHLITTKDEHDGRCLR